ncbi:MAG: 16S rRNA (guanine(966)-N(2))-methyltransferase RsmD [Planctomycetota bacterium]
MRVISGRFRGRRLEAPPGTNTRPITDRVKETLFNMLGVRLDTPGAIPAIAVLDLFAGTGGLGIEALSRGAQSCLFVERDRRSLRVLRRNLDLIGLESTGCVAVGNAWTMRIPPADDPGYGLIFLDPPYRDARDGLRVIDLLVRLAPLLSPTGLTVFRHEHKTQLPTSALRSLECVDERQLGTMRIWLFAPVAPDGSTGNHPTEG